MTNDETWVRLGVVGRPHGVRGALKLHLDNPDGGTVVAGLAVRCRTGNRSRELVVEKWAGGVLSFVGVADRSVAESLVNAVLEVKRSDFVDDEDDEGAFLIDLIGLPVFDVNGTSLGTIAAFSDNVAQVLAEVKTPGGQIVLVPFVPPIVDAIEDDRVVLAPPAGLFDDDALEAGDANSADQQAADIDGEDDGDDGDDDEDSEGGDESDKA